MGEVDELDDLLRRFDTFFREKVEAELQSVREFMHGMLSEQQFHLQQILSNRLLSKSSYCQQSSTLHSEELEGSQDRKVPETTENTTHLHSQDSSMATEESAGEETYPKSATSEILLELMSLSCELSAVLSQSKYL
ncbi:hypothetical protein ACOMHN_045623 [Nucella lapillus]